MLLAQYTERGKGILGSGIELGGLFNNAKINVDAYQKVIDDFKKIGDFSKYWKKDKFNWDDLSKAIGITDTRLRSYLKTLDDGKGHIDNTSASVEGMLAYLEKSGNMFNFAAIKATLFNAALNAGIMILASLAIDGIIKVWDKMNLTVEEQTKKVNELKTSYEGLKSEYDTLSQKQDITDAEKRRLEYLERRLELDERILKAEEHQLFEEKTGNKFTDIFDEDNYNTQYRNETNGKKWNLPNGFSWNKESYDYLSNLYSKKMDDIKVTQEQISEWTKYRDSVAKGSDEWNVYQGHIDSLQNRQTDAMKDLEDSADKMTTNLGKYTDNIEYFEERLASGDLSEEEAAIAQAHLNNWQELYNSTERMIAEIQKLNGTYDDTDDRIAKSIRSLYDDHGSVDRDAYSDDKFGYEKLLEYTSKLTPEQKELWITTTAGIHDAKLAIETFEIALYGVSKTISESGNISFDQAWGDTFTSENDAVKELSENLLGLAEKGRLTREAFELADSNAGDYFKNLGVSADEAVDKINKLVDESSQLSSMSKAISQMSEALGAKKENGFVGADTLSGFDVEVKGLDSWDRFQSVLGSTTSSYQECKDAAMALANEWMNSGNFLSQLTEQNRAYYQTQLESMGVANAEEVVMYQLALSKEEARIATLNLADMTQAAMSSLLGEAESAGITQAEIYKLAAAEIAYNSTGLDTQGKIDQLGNLAKAYGDTATAAMAAAAADRVANGHGDLETIMSDMMSQIGRAAQNSVKIDFSGIGKSAKSASKAAKEETDAMSELNSEMDKLQSAYKSLCDIKDTYNKYGKITVDQYQELTNMGFNFLANLVDENGQLGLNASAFERLAQAKLEEMQIQMARNATDTINGLKTEAEAVEYLTYATEQNRQAALGAAEAELEWAVAAAKRRGEQQGAAAEQIYKGYQASKQLAGKVDFFFDPSAQEKKEKESAKAEKEDKTDKLLEAYNKEKALLEHMLAMDQISKAEYYDKLMKLVHQYFDGDPEHQDQIWDVEESYHDYLESIKETYNWIEIFLDNLAKKANALIDKASKFISWSKKNAMINRAVKATDKQITGQTNAYAYYAEKARKVGLNNAYIDKIQNGTLTMEDMQNESLSGKIEKYQEWLIV